MKKTTKKTTKKTVTTKTKTKPTTTTGVRGRPKTLNDEKIALSSLTYAASLAPFYIDPVFDKIKLTGKAKQTALLERLTPRSEGGPNPSTEPGQENNNPYSDPDKLSEEQKKNDKSLSKREVNELNDKMKKLN